MTEPHSEVLRGTLDLLVMQTLALAPLHGWGISQRIQQNSRGTARYTLSASKYDSPERRASFQAALLERLRALPGVAHAGVAQGMPFSGRTTGRCRSGGRCSFR